MSSNEETVLLVETGRGAQLPRAGLKHQELQSIGRFWYNEIWDFLNSKRAVSKQVFFGQRWVLLTKK
jgi:hypothetical protein